MNNLKAAIEEELDSKIHLKCLYGPVHAGMSISPVRNPITKEYPESVRLTTPDNQKILGKDDDPREYFVRDTDRFIITDGKEFDLSNDTDRKQWEAIKFSDLIFDAKGKRDERGTVIVEPTERIPAVSVFRVERIIDETAQRNKVTRRLNQALNAIYSASQDAKSLRAMLLGHYVKMSSAEEVEEFLVEKAKKDPEEILNIFTSSDTKYLIAFTYAKQKGILTSKGGMFMYGEEIIGRDASTCADYFKNPKNKIITDRILNEIKEFSLDSNDSIPESIADNNLRTDNLKAQAETALVSRDNKEDAEKDKEILDSLGNDSGKPKKK